MKFMVTLSLSGTDADGDALTYSVSGNPAALPPGIPSTLYPHVHPGARDTAFWRRPW